MPKFKVYGIITASKYLGEIEASSLEEAKDKANEESGFDTWVSICHQCADEIDAPEIHEFHVEEA